MFLRPILDILWARRVIILVTTVSCMVGGGYVALTSTPRYQATAQVALDYLKPNPLTGSFVTSKTVTAYVNSQLEMVRDYQVAIPAAEALGLLDNPDLQARFAADPNSNPDGFARWVAGRIIAGTQVRAISDSNVLEISHTSTSSEGALQMVEAVRAAYVQASVDARRAGAQSSANSLTAQANLTRADLEKLQAAKRDWQNQNGVLTGTDARNLMELITSVNGFYVASASDLPLAGRLANLEVELDQASRTLGPNHPKLKTLRTTRDTLRAQLERERSAQGAVGASTGLTERAKQGAIDVQKEKVLSQRQTVLGLRLLEDEIAGREDVLKSLNAKIADLRQTMSLREADVISLGEAEPMRQAVFPNPLLIFGGTAFLGLASGSLLALFVELLGRRARTASALEAAVGARLLGVVPALATQRRGNGPAVGLQRTGGPRRLSRQGKAAA